MALSDLLKPYASDPASGSIFDEEPVPLSVFIQDRKFLGNPPLSDVQYGAVLHTERIYYPETYKLLGESQPYWRTPVRMTNFITLQWAKGCLCPHEEVYDARTGRWVVVSESAQLTVQGVDAVNDDGSTEHFPDAPSLVRGQDRVTAKTDGRPFKRGHGRCVRVTTDSGNSVDVYVGHLFSSWESNDVSYFERYLEAKPVWKQAGSLQVGDRIATLSKLDCLEPVSQDPQEVELVGYWLGDGSMPVEGSTQWAFYVDSGAEELKARYTELVESYEGITAKHEIMRSGTTRIRATNMHGRSQPSIGSCAYPESEHAPSPSLKRGLCSRHYLRAQKNGTLEDWAKGLGDNRKYPLLDIIRKYGLYGKRAWDKRVPEQFFSLPDNQVALFLSALWDTDGSIYFQRSGAPRLEYTSVSEGLARDVHRLLLRLGVVSRLVSGAKTYTYKGEKKTGRVAWRVIVSSYQYVEKFLKVAELHGRKEERRLQGLSYNSVGGQQILKGDVYWDRVKSVEEIGDHDFWDMHVPLSGSYVAGGTSFLSSNSGKDHVSRIASMRIAYLLLCLRNPQEYYGMPEQDTIHLLNVASSSPQAQQAFFMPITRVVRRGWFKDRCDPHMNTISYDKNVECISGHSDAETQEGLNLLLGVADEIDAFKTKSETSNRRGQSKREPTKSAESILDMMRSSGSTRFPEVFKNVRISYPRYLGSTIQSLTKQAKADVRSRGEKSRHYVSGPLATWEVNPRVKSKAAFEADYLEDPIMARAKYECKPSRAVNPYFRNAGAVEACFRDQLSPISLTYVPDKGAWAPVYEFAPGFVPIAGALYAMHGDLAVTGDRAGVAMAHVVSSDEVQTTLMDEDGAEIAFTETRPSVKVDFVIGFEADTACTPSREIQIRWARQLAFLLIQQGFVIKSFTFDGFESRDSRQILASKGIMSERLSTDLSTEPWRGLRDLLYEGRVTLPQSTLLKDELLSLNQLLGGKVNHPPDLSKDLADAVACAVHGAVKLGGQEDPSGERVFYAESSIELGPTLDFPQESMSNWKQALRSPLMPDDVSDLSAGWW